MPKGFRAIADKTIDRLEMRVKRKFSKFTTNTHVNSDLFSPPLTCTAERSSDVRAILRGVIDSPVMSLHLKTAAAALLSVVGAIDVCDPPFVDDLHRRFSYD